MKPAKSEFLQIRVDAKDKQWIRAQAKKAGMEMSAWVLGHLKPNQDGFFQHLVRRLSLAQLGEKTFIFTELHDYLYSLSPLELSQNLKEMSERLDLLDANYLAAMVDFACHRHGMKPPLWLEKIPTLETPYFGTDLLNLRSYLLLNSPPAFRRRNIYIDATLGDRL